MQAKMAEQNDVFKPKYFFIVILWEDPGGMPSAFAGKKFVETESAKELVCCR